MSRFLLLFFALFLLLPVSSQAAAITNLRDETLIIGRKTSEGFVPVEIDAMATWRVPGNLTITYGGNEYFLWYYDEYAVWPDGTIGPQRRVYSAGPLSR